MRHREDPLAHGHTRQHLVHEVRRLLAHASTAAAGAEPAPLAGERHESFVSAVAAAHPREAARKHATREELPELLLHEARHAGAVGALGRVAEKGLEMVADQPVEDRALRAARLVRVDGHGYRSSQGRAGRTPGRERGACPTIACVAVTSTRNIVLPSSRAGLRTQAPTVPSGGWTACGGRGG